MEIMKKIVCFVISIILVLSVVAVSDNAVSAKVIKKKGYYYTALQKKKSSVGYIKKVKVKGRKIITYGSFLYRKTASGNRNMIGVKKRTFVISKKCKFYNGCWTPGGERRINKATALRILKQVWNSDSPTGYELKVSNGKIVKMMFGQN